MAHFAELDENDIVLRVVVVANETITVDGVEDEAVGVAFCQSLFGPDTRWAQTSYNGNMRVRYAGIGYWFDRQNDVFITPKPYESWTLDPVSYAWVAPVPRPDGDAMYRWDEASLSWIEIPLSPPPLSPPV